MRPLLATLVGLAVAVPIPTATATGQQPRFDLAPTMAFLGESVSGAIEDRDVERCAWIALAFLADGSTLRNGRYKDPLKLVLRDLRTWQDDRGRFAPGGTPCARAAQLLASLAMTECYGLSNYKLLQRNVVQAAAATLDELARAGHTALGADELASAHPDVSLEDRVRTAVEATARMMRDAWEWHVRPGREELRRILLSGGGCHNPTLVSAIRDAFADLDLEVETVSPELIDLKEAVAFALLAHEALHDRPGNIPAATGAPRDMRLGTVHRP